MSTVETKPVRLNWIHVDDDLSFADVVLIGTLMPDRKFFRCYKGTMRVFCERVQTGWLISADASSIAQAKILHLMSDERISVIYSFEEQIPEYLREHGLKIVECA